MVAGETGRFGTNAAARVREVEGKVRSRDRRRERHAPGSVERGRSILFPIIRLGKLTATIFGMEVSAEPPTGAVPGMQLGGSFEGMEGDRIDAVSPATRQLSPRRLGLDRAMRVRF
jgi:hypothetical protein